MLLALPLVILVLVLLLISMDADRRHILVLLYLLLYRLLICVALMHDVYCVLCTVCAIVKCKR